MSQEFESGVLPLAFFKQCELDYNNLQDKPAKTPEQQSELNNLIQRLEKLWDHFRVGKFYSRNEELDEYSNSTLRFFLIPFFIGRLHLNFQGAERPAHLEAASAYLTAFSDQMVHFKIAAKELPPPTNPNERRNRVIAEYAERRELEERLKRMSQLTKPGEERGQLGDQVDEQYERETIMDLLKLSVIEARSSARAAAEELPFAKMHAAGIKPEEPKEPPRKPWFHRIDREQIRNKVFAPLEDVMPHELPPDDETFATPGEPGPDINSEIEEERERARIKQAKWDDWKDDHPPFSVVDGFHDNDKHPRVYEK